MAAKEIKYDSCCPRKDAQGDRAARSCRAGHARPQGAERRARQVVRRTQEITKDGVTVAKEIELADNFENMGAQMVREATSRTSDVAGDGTTTATVLAAAIVREGPKCVAAGMNPMDLKRGIDMAVIRGHRAGSGRAAQDRGLDGSSRIAQVGTISANGEQSTSAT